MRVGLVTVLNGTVMGLDGAVTFVPLVTPRLSALVARSTLNPVPSPVVDPRVAPELAQLPGVRQVPAATVQTWNRAERMAVAVGTVKLKDQVAGAADADELRVRDRKVICEADTDNGTKERPRTTAER